jgi:hypothetical protein
MLIYLLTFCYQSLAKKQVPKSYSGELIGSCRSTHIEPNGSIFYEEFDFNNATVKEVA